MVESISELRLDASDFIDEADSATDSAEELGSTSEEVQDSIFGFDNAGNAAAAGIGAMGGAITATTEGSKDWRESLGRTRVNLGMTQDEVEDLAGSISNATFPMDDAVDTMSALSQIGVEGADDMQLFAGAADDIADATGTSATSIAENLAPSVKALDGNLDGLVEQSDAFVLAANESSLSIEEVGSTIERLDFGQLQEMGLSAGDTAGLIAEFAEETGYSGRVLRSEFRSAMEDADGDLDAFTEGLGLGDNAMESWNERLAESEGITQEYANAANESNTVMDEVSSVVDKATLKFGGMLAPVDALGPAMMGLAGAKLAFGSTITTAVLPALTSMLPLIAGLAAPILALAAAAAVLYLAWDNNFLGIQDITGDVVAWIEDAIGNFLAYIEGVFGEHLGDIKEEVELTVTAWRESFSAFVEWAEPYIDAFLGVLSALWDVFGDDAIETVDTLTSTAKRIFEDFVSIVMDVFTAFFRLLRGDFDGAKEAILGIVDTLTTGIVDLFSWLYNKIVGGSIIPDLVRDVIGYVTGLKDDAIELVTGLRDSVIERFESVKTGVTDRVTELKDDAITLSRDLRDRTLESFTDLKDRAIGLVGDLATGVRDFFSGLITDAWSWGRDIIGRIADGVRSRVSKLASDFRSVARDAANAFKEKFNSLIPSSIEIPGATVSVPDLLGGGTVGVDGTSISIPQLDTGGFIERDGLAMLHAGETVSPARVDRSRRGGDDVDITINVDGSRSPERTAREIERRLESGGVNAWRS